MIKSSPQYPVDMLDKREIPFVQSILLRLVSCVKRHLLTPVNQPAMLKSKLALQSRFVCDILAEWRCQCPHYICTYLD
jgi:hypothetical protein